MPKAASKKQYRMMMAILHGKPGSSARGDSVPKSVAGKYASGGSDSDLPESKGKEHDGGKWGEKGHAKAKQETDKKRSDKKKRKAELRKALETFIKSGDNKGAGCLVVDRKGRILLGRRSDNGMWSTPGGHVEAGESFSEGALRELREETGLTGQNTEEIHSDIYRGLQSKTFTVNSYKGRLKSNGEMLNLHFMDVCEIPWNDLTDYARDSLSIYIAKRLKKTKDLRLMLAHEDLQKNIMRGGKNSFIEFDVTHGDALKLIGNGTFRILRDAVSSMDDEDFRELAFDSYRIHIRKHMNDVYSGRITDGHKQIHQFANKSLPQVSVELMSIFEWYLPEDESELEIMDDDSLDDDAIEGGLNSFVDKYKQHNIANIYSEMENIREEVRHDMAVDLQQVEIKIMQLFDKLEEIVINHADKHNVLSVDAGDAIDELERKMIALQTRVEQLNSAPTTVEAYTSTPHSHQRVHDNSYPYLTKPQILISPDGKVKITFQEDWTYIERSDFLKDMKANIIKKQGNA